MDFFDASGAVIGSAIGGMLAAYGAYTGVGMLASTAGGVAIAELSGVAATNVTLAWLVAGPALAILGAISADEMKEKLEKAKAYHSQVEEAVKKTDAIIDQFQAIEKMDKLFTRQITKCDALFFSLSQDAIATMKKHNYNHSLYSQEERDQLCVAVSTLMTLSAFLKMPKEKAQRALEIMIGQMDALESGHYDAKMIQSRQKDLENL
ncbi:hypothetical protein HpHCM55_07050 [Helicobacter pylori]